MDLNMILGPAEPQVGVHDSDSENDSLFAGAAPSISSGDGQDLNEALRELWGLDERGFASLSSNFESGTDAHHYPHFATRQEGIGQAEQAAPRGENSATQPTIRSNRQPRPAGGEHTRSSTTSASTSSGLRNRHADLRHHPYPRSSLRDGVVSLSRDDEVFQQFTAIYSAAQQNPEALTRARSLYRQQNEGAPSPHSAQVPVASDPASHSRQSLRQPTNVDRLAEMEFGFGENSANEAQHNVIDLTTGSDDELAFPRPDNPRTRPEHVDPVSQRRDARADRTAEIYRRQQRRRDAGLNHRTPSFTRSDGSLLGRAADFVDLTNDDADDAMQRLMRSQERNSDGREFLPANPHYSRRPGHGDLARRQPMPAANTDSAAREPFQAGLQIIDVDELPSPVRGYPPRSAPRFGRDLLNGVRELFGFPTNILMEQGMNFGAVELAGERVGGLFDGPVNPLAGNQPNLNYGGPRTPSPKRAYQCPQAARVGFTRNTGENEDDRVICPSCSEELKYDPDAEPETSTKPAKNKKGRAEHHFWTVKECGHVYCKKCYRHRTAAKSRGANVGFRFVDKKSLCAVDDCESDVTAKSAWVGLFV